MKKELESIQKQQKKVFFYRTLNRDDSTVLILKEDPKKILLEDPNTLEVTLENMTLYITISSDMMAIWVGLERILFDQIETPNFIIWGVRMPVPFGEEGELFNRWAIENK